MSGGKHSVLWHIFPSCQNWQVSGPIFIFTSLERVPTKLCIFTFKFDMINQEVRLTFCLNENIEKRDIDEGL